MYTTTLPIPAQLIKRWNLPSGWEKLITIQVSGGDRIRGNSESIALAYQPGHNAPWMFSVRTQWLPARCRTKATMLSQLSLEEFRLALEFKAGESLT